ncbi:hypothetical protein HHI36_015845 [Cryptolaemus montrouzieri]|uniref:Tetratricopeptide SHNi-TPR domain-containing protein n=1 Tax=Cryptolaemus montrouzieri TaxID=559131 RepID=A0ABD2N853_9CUCU
MADVIIDPENKNAKELLSQGIRAFVLQDYTVAVQALGKASELLVSEHGDDLHESLGDVYFYYGKALLALSRQEAEPLGDAVPKGDDGSEEEEEEEDEEVDNSVNEEKDKTGDTEAAKEDEAKIEAGASEEKTEDGANGKTEENGGTESTDPKDDNDEPTDLQVAWEVLELAKKIFEKKGSTGKKQLAETLTALGEISLESENFEAAISDMKDGLAIQQEIYSKDSRKVAETCYNLGVAFSTNSQLDEAIEAFNKSLEYLKTRIDVLEKQGDGEEEIKEIKELIPELLEKIADIKGYKEEVCKESCVCTEKLIETFKNAKICEKSKQNGKNC